MTIGVLFGNMCTTHSSNMMKGIINSADEKNMKALFFMGAHANCYDELKIHSDNVAKAEPHVFQYNTIFEFAKLGKLDALIIAYSTFYMYTFETKEEFFARFKNIGIPVITVGDSFEGIPNVMSDNKDGIRKCMMNLINEHGFKKIAYLGGPRYNNKDAAERLEAYYEVMKEQGIEVTDTMVEFGDYTSLSAPLFGKLLDNNPGLEAVVCANDTMAIAGYDECIFRGLKPGVDIAITGFDDNPEAKTVTPALTTVAQNTYELGFTAVNKVCDILTNNDYSDALSPVSFISRESCGGKSQLEQLFCDEDFNDIKILCKKMSASIVEKSELYRSKLSNDNKILNKVEGVIYHILEVYTSNTPADYDFRLIKTALLSLVEYESIDFSKFMMELGNKMLELTAHNPDFEKNFTLCHLILEINEYFSTIILIHNFEKTDTLQHNLWSTPYISKIMIEHYKDERSMYTKLMERLQSITPNTIYLFLLKEPVIAEGIHDWTCPNEARLVIKVENGVIKYDNETVINADQGIADIIDFGSSKMMSAYSLFSDNRIYGFLICQLDNGMNVTTLYNVCQSISSAYDFITLTENQNHTQAELTHAMDMLQSKNYILSMISEKDELTGLFNRRGFLENAIRNLEGCHGGYVMCMYVDLDHLKQINDQFGHGEGDFSIKQVGVYLKDNLRDTDIIGRIGGDEFAVLATIGKIDLADEIVERIKISERNFNKLSDKPYYVEISIGTSVHKFEPGLNLNQMLSEADGKLYESKKLRRSDAKK